jgi:hypothetical protein
VCNNFTEVDANADLGLSVFECRRAACLPPLIVRRARIEDHDDLLPVLQRGAARHPALAQLPAWCALMKAIRWIPDSGSAAAGTLPTRLGVGESRVGVREAPPGVSLRLGVVEEEAWRLCWVCWRGARRWPLNAPLVCFQRVESV